MERKERMEEAVQNGGESLGKAVEERFMMGESAAHLFIVLTFGVYEKRRTWPVREITLFLKI